MKNVIYNIAAFCNCYVNNKRFRFIKNVFKKSSTAIYFYIEKPWEPLDGLLSLETMVKSLHHLAICLNFWSYLLFCFSLSIIPLLIIYFTCLTK